MKIAIVTPNNLWYCPFADIYRVVFEELGVDYDIITWCRDGKDEPGCIQYKNTWNLKGRWSKFIPYLSFASFVKKIIKQNKYDRIVALTPQVGIFLTPFLRLHYNRKYIADYRDISIEQIPFFKPIYRYHLEHSAANFVSSPGFIPHLPKNVKYLLSHNFIVANVKNAIGKKVELYKDGVIDILTIGGIRDYKQNISVAESVANNPDFSVRFVGRGIATIPIKEECAKRKYENVSVIDFYKKEEEPDYVKQSTFLNIFYPRSLVHDTAVSNRFYNALIYRKPMIVTKGTTQGDFAEKYHVGLAIDNTDNLPQMLKDYLKSDDYLNFSSNCDVLLEQLLDDYYKFYNCIKSFVEK